MNVHSSKNKRQKQNKRQNIISRNAYGARQVRRESCHDSRVASARRKGRSKFEEGGTLDESKRAGEVGRVERESRARKRANG